MCVCEFVGMSLSIVWAYKTRPSPLFIGGQAALLLLLSMLEQGLLLQGLQFGGLSSAADFWYEKFRPTFHEKWDRLVLLGLTHIQSTIHEKWIRLGAADFRP